MLKCWLLSALAEAVVGVEGSGVSLSSILGVVINVTLVPFIYPSTMREVSRLDSSGAHAAAKCPCASQEERSLDWRLHSSAE
ncbi:MAG: hypothetical protein U0Z26_13415 [Anaerolineales bacterium]